MDKNLTAVEWLVEQFENHRATFFKLNDKEERVITLAGRDVIEQAKEMEKEQMIDAINTVSENNVKYANMIVSSWSKIEGELFMHNTKLGEQYYNETYGGNK